MGIISATAYRHATNQVPSVVSRASNSHHFRYSYWLRHPRPPLYTHPHSSHSIQFTFASQGQTHFPDETLVSASLGIMSAILYRHATNQVQSVVSRASNSHHFRYSFWMRHPSTLITLPHSNFLSIGFTPIVSYTSLQHYPPLLSAPALARKHSYHRAVGANANTKTTLCRSLLTYPTQPTNTFTSCSTQYRSNLFSPAQWRNHVLLACYQAQPRSLPW
jgi:PhoPQ-activated pathogenicity-related protein